MEDKVVTEADKLRLVRIANVLSRIAEGGSAQPGHVAYLTKTVMAKMAEEAEVELSEAISGLQSITHLEQENAALRLQASELSNAELNDTEVEAALSEVGIHGWGPDGERFEKMFAAAMKARQAHLTQTGKGDS